MKYFSDLETINEDYNQKSIQHLIIMAHSQQMEDHVCKMPIQVVKELYCKTRYLTIETINYVPYIICEYLFTSMRNILKMFLI